MPLIMALAAAHVLASVLEVRVNADGACRACALS